MKSAIEEISMVFPTFATRQWNKFVSNPTQISPALRSFLKQIFKRNLDLKMSSIVNHRDQNPTKEFAKFSIVTLHLTKLGINTAPGSSYYQQLQETRIM